METITISTTYSLKWQIKDAPSYKVSPCGKLFNIKRKKEVKRVMNGGSVGFWIKGEFNTLKQLRSRLIKIENVDCPF